MRLLRRGDSNETTPTLHTLLAYLYSEGDMRKRDKEWARKQGKLYRQAFGLGEYGPYPEPQDERMPREEHQDEEIHTMREEEE